MGVPGMPVAVREAMGLDYRGRAAEIG